MNPLDILKIKISTSKIELINLISRLVDEITDQILSKIESPDEKINIENLPNPTLVTDIDGNILTANPSLVHLFGYSSETNFLEINAVDHYVDPNQRNIFIKQLKTKDVVEIKLQLKKKDGSIFWAKITGKKDSNSDHIYTSFEEITKEIQETEKNKAMFEQCPIGMMKMTESKEIFINQALKKILGIHNEETLTYQKLFFNKEDLLNKFFSEQIFTITFSYNGKSHTLEFTPITVENNEYLYFVEDVDQRNKYVKELLAMFAEDSINTLLHHINSILQLLSIQFEKQYLDIAIEATQNLFKIINRIKEYLIFDTKIINTEKYNIKKSDISQSIQEIFDITISELKYDQNSINFKINIDKSIPVEFLLDFNIFHNILNPIINNAIKFSKKETSQSSIEINVDFEKNNSYLVFDIKDNGKKIPENLWLKIFEPLFQVYKTLTTKMNGIGMGLAFAKIYADKTGIKIFVKESSDEGTTMCVKVPIEVVE